MSAGGGGDGAAAAASGVPGQVGIIGGGMMGSALARGLIDSGVLKASQVSVSDPGEACLDRLRDVVGAVTSDNVAVVRDSDVVILAVKPHYVETVLKGVTIAAGESKLLVSIAAGVSIATLQRLAPEARVVRVMPNTPALVGCGAAGFALGPSATKEDGVLVQKLMSAVGVAEQVSENLIDAVTGLSGSGPAYVFQVIEAMADGGVRAGLPRPIAQKLAAQTVKGAAMMVLESGKHPGELKDQVCSPGGTTIAGVHELERGALRATLMNAVFAAASRATELKKENS